MQIPLQITFRQMDPSPALEARIREESARLDKFNEHIMSCRVVVESPHKHKHKGKLYHIHIDLKVPGKEIVVTREHHDNQAHEDVYVTIRDAFNSMQRQLEDHIRRQRGEVKSHEMPSHGRVLALLPMEDYGKIETPDGRIIYFHHNSVLDNAYDKLEVGSEVRFVEEAGEQGPQASTVMLIGKHHIRD